jgi:hypothetical protein
VLLEKRLGTKGAYKILEIALKLSLRCIPSLAPERMRRVAVVLDSRCYTGAPRTMLAMQRIRISC